jgi:hypothetical protein
MGLIWSELVLEREKFVINVMIVLNMMVVVPVSEELRGVGVESFVGTAKKRCGLIKAVHVGVYFVFII